MDFGIVRSGPAFAEGAVSPINGITTGQLLLVPLTVLAAISAMPEPAVQERRLQIWSHPAWTGLLVLLMSLFWVGRKAAGTF